MIVKYLVWSCESLSLLSRSLQYHPGKSQLRSSSSSSLLLSSGSIFINKKNASKRHSAVFMSSSSNNSRMIVEIHPLSSEKDLMFVSKNDSTCVKKVHFVRHAEGTHNVENNYKCISNLDARLTKLGEQQCATLAKSSSSSLLKNVELVVTSPLTRCIQTALLSFSTTNVVFVAHESIRETVNYNCDRRRSIQHLMKEFPQIHFDHYSPQQQQQETTNDDPIWKEYEDRLNDTMYYDSHRESAELYKVADRGRMFFQWLSLRKEREVIVSTHSAFLRCIFNWGLPGGVPHAPIQHLDTRSEAEKKETIPVVTFVGDNDEFETKMRSDYANCEMRSFLVVMKQNHSSPTT